MKFLFAILLNAITLLSFAQTAQRKDYFPIWTFDQSNIRIHGISIGFLTDNVNQGKTLTNGLRLELLGLGFLSPIMPGSTVVNSEEDYDAALARGINQKVNGINLCTTGTIGNCHINGLTVGGVGQSMLKVNGVSLSGLMNLVQKQNGLMIAMFNDAFFMNGAQMGFSNKAHFAKGLQVAALNNYADDCKGLQVGLINKSIHLKGLQFGLWNVNQKRKLPIVNWCFSDN